MIPANINALLLGEEAGGAAAYAISRSLRFNSSDSAYLSRTPASAGNRKTWTWSGWVKISTSNNGALFSATATNSGSSDHRLNFDTDRLQFQCWTNGSVVEITTTAVFRDLSSWYHIVLAVDTTQSTSSNRVKFYVNGSQLTSFSASNYPTQNFESVINAANRHAIGRNDGNSSNYFGGYLADIHFIDGQALDPSSFAETNITTGQWVPKAYTGTYGTNGFRLAFADNSNNTATTLGKDSSPNGNNWTPNNLSVTAGAGNDSLVDTPTSYGTDTGAGGEVRGNYATLNPLDSGSIALANGNLDATFSSGSSWNTSRATIWVSSGKWYWETTIGTVTSGQPVTVGIAQSTLATSSYIGGNAGSYGYYAGGKRNNGTDSAYGASFATGDVIGTALDLDAGTITFYKNGASQGQAFSSLSGIFAPGISLFVGQTSSATVFNSGARPFAYTAPSGFKALCDTNLPAPVVAKPSTAMDVKLYTGNGSTQTISGLGFSPDFVWLKARSAAYNHSVFDAVRGAGVNLLANATSAEFNGGTNSGGELIAFNSDGFNLGACSNAGTNNVNNPNGTTFAAWCWDAGSSTVTNTAGSIQSSVRANASAGFSVVTYTGVGSTGTVGHGLGVAPSFYIVKARTTTAANSWRVYHSALGNTKQLFLEDTAAASTNSSAWNNTNPTSTVFSVGSLANESSGNYVAYCFAPVAGYSAFGSYTGNGSADGPFIYLGFRPAVVLVKMSSSTGNWTILDDKREGYNVDNDPLYPNLSDAEGTTDLLDITSNGFKVRTTDATFNTNAGTYVYAAWASSPFAYSRAR